MKARYIWHLILALMLIAPWVHAQQSAGQLLQSGLYKEEVEGDLRGAIQIYEQILKDFPDERPVSAQALLRIGLSYEKLGTTEAQEAYRRLLQEFADQMEIAQIARERLQQLDAGLPGQQVISPTYRIVMSDETPGLHPLRYAKFDFSSNGRVVFSGSGEDQNKLYISDETGTIVRPLLRELGQWNSITHGRWSPDGQLVAYVAAIWSLGSEAAALRAIFVVKPGGGAPQQVGPAVENMVLDLTWAQDSKHLMYAVWDGFKADFHMRSVEDGTDRAVFENMQWVPSIGECSPDGRWLAFHMRDVDLDDSMETDIWLASFSDGSIIRLTESPGFDAHPTWAKDGRSIYFVSARTGDCNIWRLGVDPETGNPIGEAQQITSFSDSSIVFPKVIGEGGRIAFGLSKTASTILAADASQPDEARAVARGISPQLSPDGQTIYYISQEPDVAGIFSIPRHGGVPKRLTHHSPTTRPSFHVSPDGERIVYFADVADESSNRGVFVIPATGGQPILLLEFETRRSITPRWSPDGSRIAYVHGDSICVIPADGGKSLRIAQLHGWEPWTIRWSPDGKLIAALGYLGMAEGEDEVNAVFVVSEAGGEPKQLTPADVYKEGLEWHPDGERLTYHVSQKISETRQVHLDGRPPSLLVDRDNPVFWDYVGVWAPDGDSFFFESYDNEDKGRSGVYIYHEPTGEITLFSLSARLPCWSRDGKTMAWTTEKEILQLWVMENYRTE